MDVLNQWDEFKMIGSFVVLTDVVVVACVLIPAAHYLLRTRLRTRKLLPHLLD
jgi:hypothetical protein